LYDIITYYNGINNINEEYKVLWKQIVDEKYALLCEQFGKNLPCMEGFINDLENTLNYIKTEPTKPVDIEIKTILSIDDFKNDGGFNKRITPNMKDWEIVGLSLSCFRLSLCGTYNNCELDNENVRNAYNTPNYNTYLDYIHFYEKNPSLTKENVISLESSKPDNVSQEEWDSLSQEEKNQIIKCE
jgi:hypothetical protein